MPTINPEHANFPRATFLRRLGAIVYDTLIAAGILIFAVIAGFIVFVILIETGLISDHGYKIVSDALLAVPLYKGIWQLYLTVTLASFYAYFWSRGGQTLGMRTWRLKIQHPNGQSIGMVAAYARVIWSLLGIGNLFILLSSDKLALQDRMTRTEVVQLSKEANEMKNWKRS